MIITLSGEVKYEMLETLAKAIDSGENLEIYFTSPEGGYTDVAEAMLYLINSHKEKIKMVFYGEVYSSGMIIFLRSECEKYLLPDTVGMYHFSWQSLDIAEGGQPTTPKGHFALKEMKKSKERTIAFLKTTKLSQKEINSIKRGIELYFSHERMRELVVNAI